MTPLNGNTKLQKMTVTGKKCLVTGSTAGIGKDIAFQLLEQGATVFINGRSEAKVNLTKQEAIERGFRSDQIHALVADLSIPKAVKRRSTRFSSPSVIWMSW